MMVADSCSVDAFTWVLSKMKGRNDGIKYRGMLQENLLQSAKKNLKLGINTFQQDNCPNPSNPEVVKS